MNVMGDLSEKFFKVYSGVPIEERNNTIAIIDGEPVNWHLAFQEIKNKTERGKKILNILKKLEII
jgi:hypothetical protein